MGDVMGGVMVAMTQLLDETIIHVDSEQGLVFAYNGSLTINVYCVMYDGHIQADDCITLDDANRGCATAAKAAAKAAAQEWGCDEDED